MLETLSNAMIVAGALAMARPARIVFNPHAYSHVLREAYGAATEQPMPHDILALQKQVGAKLHLVKKG